MPASIAGRLPGGPRFDFPVSLARIACISCALFVGACTSEGPLIHKTVNTDEATATVFATRADRRLAYLTGDGHFLAEPSPDAFQLVSTALEASASADAKDQVNAAASFAYKASRELEKLSRRSQGVILFRDASYRLAEAQLNFYISNYFSAVDGTNGDDDTRQVSPREWMAEFDKLVERCDALIRHELDGNPTLRSDQPEDQDPDD